MSASARLLGFSLLLATGCAHQIRVVPPASEPTPAGGLAPAPLLLEGVSVVNRFGAGEANDGFMNRVVMELRRTRAFESVLPPAAAASG